MSHGTAVRLEAVFTGNVQGVFFRATTEQVAQRFAVTGVVRNEPDGSVRLVAEGERDEVQRFLTAVQQAKRANIRDTQTQWHAASGEFPDFRISYD